MEDDITNGGGEEESDRLVQPSFKSNWIQKIIGSARVGGISGPLVRVYFPLFRS